MIELTAEQNKIVDAAFARFAKYGHENTTMNQIAKDLGYTRTFLYYYFQDKESIFKMALIRCANKYFDSLKKELQKKIAGIKMLENAIRTKIYCAREFQIIGVFTNPNMYKILLEDPDLLYIFPTEQKLLVNIINAGKKDASIIKCHSIKTAQQITDGLSGYMSFGLQQLRAACNLNPKSVEALFKRQINYGLLLTQALKK